MIRRLSVSLMLFFLVLVLSKYTLSAQSCGELAPRLRVGEQARITPGPPNIVRAVPGVSGDYLGEIPGEAYVDVLEGPQCGSGYYWFRVRYGELEGWTVESGDGVYWIDPIDLIPTNTPLPSLTPTYTPTATMTPLPSFTPTVTLTPSITPTPFPIQLTAQALGISLTATDNWEWRVVSRTFNGVEMVLVPSGCYNRNISDRQVDAVMTACRQSSYARSFTCDPMLLNRERVDEQICFAEPFWIDRYEVSHIQYETVGTGGDSPHPWEYVRWGDNYPRGDVTVKNANDHCVGRDARLPYDTEWEYAARGPSGFIFPWGDFYESDYAVHFDTVEYFYNTDGSGIPKPQEVSVTNRDVSWVGAVHMAGNFSEFVQLAKPVSVAGNDQMFGWRGGEAIGYALDLRLTRPPDDGHPTMGLFIGFRCARSFDIQDLDSE